MASRPDIENRATLRPVTDAKFEAQDNGQGMIGRGLAAFGQGIAAVSEDLQAIEDVHDDAAVKSVDAEVLLAEGELTRAVRNAKGENALAARSEYDAGVQRVKEEALAKLGNPRQKKMFTDMFDRRIASSNGAVNEHIDAETRTYAVDTSKSRTAALASRAIDFYDKPDEFEKTVVSINNEIAARGLLEGLNADTVKLEQEQTLSAVHVGVAESLLAGHGDTLGDPLKTLEYVNANAKYITAEDETKLRQRLQPAVVDAKVADDANDIIRRLEGGEFDAPPPALELDKDGKPVVPNGAPADAPKIKSGGSAGHPYRNNSMYNAVLGDGAYGLPSKPVTEMTMGEVYDFGRSTLIPNSKAKGVGKLEDGTVVGSSAMGAYQFVGGTMAEYAKKIYGDNWRSMKFTPEVQDRLGKALYEDTKHGNLKKVWEGLPNTQMGYYASAGWDKVKDTITKHEVGDDSNGGTGDFTPEIDGDRVDLQAAYAAVEATAKEKQWPNWYKDQVIGKIDNYAQRQDNIRNREYAAADDAASEVVTGIIKSGGDVTDPVKQIPNFAKLHPDTQRRYLEQAEAIKARQQAAAAAAAAARQSATVAGNLPTYLNLLAMANSDPDTFLTIDIDSLRGSVTDAQWTQLKVRHDEYRRQGTYRPQLAPKDSQINSIVSSVMGQAGIDKKKSAEYGSIDAQKAAYLADEIRKGVDAIQQGGVVLSDAQIQEQVVKPLLKKVVVETPGYFYGTNQEEMPWYEAKQVKGAVVKAKKD